MRLKIFVLFTFVPVFAFAQHFMATTYNVADIPENLKKDADAVYRLDEAVVNVISPSKYTEQVHQVVTILNSEGAWHLQQAVWLDKFNAVDDIEVKVYDSLGRQLQKYRKKDFALQNYYDGFSLATDDKMMTLSAAAPAFPCTVEVKYTLSVSGYIELPNGYLNNGSSAIEQFRFIVKVPSNLDIRHRTVNMKLVPVISESDKQKTYTWETKNVGVHKIAAGGYNGSKHFPAVEVSPVEFEYDGYKGTFNDWKDFGAWCYALYEDKNAFNDKRAAEIKAMVKDMPDANSKIKVLYDYMKNNMRYVSIQFGIGGYRPFQAKFVDEKKYGDCKALTNYMHNLLSVAGIKSYPALINAGFANAPVTPDFPQNVFNHVILCIPGSKDTTWLECTSTKSDAGFLGSFTENKNALLLTENGGIMVATPTSDYTQNKLATKNDVFINKEGGATVKTTLNSSGDCYAMLEAVGEQEPGKQKELFVTNLHYKEPDEFIMAETSDKADRHRINLQLVYTKLFDFKAGNKYFFPKTINTLLTDKLVENDHRKIEYLFQYPYIKTDTTAFHLPSDFKVDNLPEAKEISGETVYYKRTVQYDEKSNIIQMVTDLFLKKHIILPEQYSKTYTVLANIEKEETIKLILKK